MRYNQTLVAAPWSPMAHLLAHPRAPSGGFERLTELVLHQRDDFLANPGRGLLPRLAASQVQRGMLLERAGRQFTDWPCVVASVRRSRAGLLLELVAGSRQPAFVLSNDHPHPFRGISLALPASVAPPVEMMEAGTPVHASGAFLLDTSACPITNDLSNEMGLFMPRFVTRFEEIALA